MFVGTLLLIDKGTEKRLIFMWADRDRIPMKI